MEKLKKNWYRYLVHAAALAPLAVMLWDYWQGRFLVDLVREVTARTGQTAIKLLVLTLACTPINTLFGIKQVVKVRRALGLYTFLYASLHFITFIWLDYGLEFKFIVDGIVDQPFVLVGIAAASLMLPLAITSTKGWMKRLGKKWKHLHKLVYAAGVLVVLHFFLLGKDNQEPMVYAGVVLFLFIVRLPAVRRWLVQTRRRLKTGLRNLASPAAQP